MGDSDVLFEIEYCFLSDSYGNEWIAVITNNYTHTIINYIWSLMKKMLNQFLFKLIFLEKYINNFTHYHIKAPQNAN